MSLPCSTSWFLKKSDPDHHHVRGVMEVVSIAHLYFLVTLGVILYILLVGYPPFWHDDHAELYKQIQAGD